MYLARETLEGLRVDNHFRTLVDDVAAVVAARETCVLHGGLDLGREFGEHGEIVFN